VLPGVYAQDLYVWAIQGKSGKYLAIPDARYPGRRPIRFFTSKVGATRLMNTVLELKPLLEKQNLVVVEVGLLVALQKAKADTVPPRADSFVINNPDEVVDFVAYLRKKKAENMVP
jgi:hypothetical protein